MRTKHEALHQTEIATQYQQMLVTALVAAGMQPYSTHAAVAAHMQQYRAHAAVIQRFSGGADSGLSRDASSSAVAVAARELRKLTRLSSVFKLPEMLADYKDQFAFLGRPEVCCWGVLLRCVAAVCCCGVLLRCVAELCSWGVLLRCVAEVCC